MCVPRHGLRYGMQQYVSQIGLGAFVGGAKCYDGFHKFDNLWIFLVLVTFVASAAILEIQNRIFHRHGFGYDYLTIIYPYWRFLLNGRFA